MVLREERELVVEYGKKLSQEKLSVGTSGNISVYNAEEGLMAITPSGMDYMKLKPEDAVSYTHLVNGDSNIILTSALKKMDVVVYNELNLIKEGKFEGKNEILSSSTDLSLIHI